MNRKKAIITIGVLIALLPALGFPSAWESYFQVMAGLSLILLSVWSSIDKKLSLRAKAHKRQEVRKIMEEATSADQNENSVQDIIVEPEEVEEEKETEEETQEEPVESQEPEKDEKSEDNDGNTERSTKTAAKKPKRKYTRRVTDLYPKTGQRGRRTTDINWNPIDSPLP